MDRVAGYRERRSGRDRVSCCQGRLAKRCHQRSTCLEAIDNQIEENRCTFHFPEDTMTQIIAFHERAGDERDDSERRRREIEGRLERITERQGWPDLATPDCQVLSLAGGFDGSWPRVLRHEPVRSGPTQTPWCNLLAAYFLQ